TWACGGDENCWDTVADCGVPPKAVMLAAGPGMIRKGLLSAGISSLAVARRRLFPVSGMCRSLKVAKPVTSVCCNRVPSNAPAPEERERAMGTPATLTGWPEVSCTRTVTGGLMTCPAAVFVGCCTKASELDPTGRLVNENKATPVIAAEETVTA